MKIHARTATVITLAALALFGTATIGYTVEPPPAMTAPTIDEWSQNIWRSAQRGDREALNRYFEQLPDETDNAVVLRVRDSLSQRQANAAQFNVKREESRAEASREMLEHYENGEVLQAVNQALTVQSLSDDMNAALGDPTIAKIIAEADHGARSAEQEGDWLYARELLFHLRTMFEDTDRYEKYEAYDDRLKAVTRRVSLLAYYAPRQLHDLRNELTIRLGEEPLKPFNEAMAVSWNDRIDNVDHRALVASIEQASRSHIEGVSPGPLMRGGLESLKLFVTTSDLAETFSGLSSESDVRQWVSFLDSRMKSIDNGRRGARDQLNSLLSEILTLNEETIRIDDGVLLREFGDGAMNVFDDQFDDPYTEIIWPNQIRRFRQATQGQFVGVGILISHDERRDIQVVQPLEGSPAYFAGVKPEDRIVEVDGRPTAGWSLNDAVDHITGRKGTTVTLGLRREGEEDLVEVPIVRDVIKMYSVRGWEKTGLKANGEPQWNWMIDPESRIAYIRVSEFSEDTTADLVKAWNDISDRGEEPPAGLVVDLRYNPGGLLDAAVGVSRLFIDRGAIVSGEDRDQRTKFSYGADLGLATIGRHRVPTVILINKGSASASEIVAGALQAHGLAVVVGERSHGKGSVQTVHGVSNETALKLTTQYYRLPGGPDEPRGRLVHKRPGAKEWGVEPNIKVTMTPEQVRRSIEIRQESDIIPEDESGEPDPNSPDRQPIDELLTSGVDPQLETALLILQARAVRDLVGDARHARLQ